MVENVLIHKNHFCNLELSEFKSYSTPTCLGKTVDTKEKMKFQPKDHFLLQIKAIHKVLGFL